MVLKHNIPIYLLSLVLDMLEHYYKELLNYLTHLVGNKDEASDILQDTYVRALTKESMGPNKTISDQRAFLFQTAKNLQIDHYRKSVIRQYDDIDELELKAPETTQPDFKLDSLQLTHSLLSAIDGLSPRCRQAFILYKFDNLSQIEIANLMGISLNMVEKHIIKGMLACKACVESNNIRNL